MLTDHFERFMRLERRSIPDKLCGEEVSWQPVGHFLGALTHHSGQEISAGSRAVLRLTPVLLHESGVALHPGDRIRRERDGSLWRVTGHSDDMRAPAFSGLAFAQVPVEGVVTGC